MIHTSLAVESIVNYWSLPNDNLNSWKMSKTFLIGTGDRDPELRGSETICELEALSVWAAMALCPSSKFIESNSKELVSMDIELVAGTLSRS